MATRKVNFARAVVGAITAFAKAVEGIETLDDIYKHSDYAPNEPDEITVEDLASYEVTVGDLANASTFAENMELFLHDGVPMQFDYAKAIDRFRNM